MLPEPENTKLIHRLSRIQGQLEGLKALLNQEEPNCRDTILLLKASHQALKKFGEVYMTEYLSHCLRTQKNKDIESDLKEAIQTAFLL